MNKFSPIDMSRNAHFKNTYYETYSYKIKRNIKLFNELEYKNFLVNEMNPRVVEFCEYPIKIELNDEEGYEETSFDMWVKYEDGKEEMQMVKNIGDIKDNTNINTLAKRRILIQDKWCKINGYEYSIVTEAHINLGNFHISNLRFLFGLIKRNENTVLRRYLKLLCSELSNAKNPLGTFANNGLVPYDLIYSVVALGVYDGKLMASLTDKIIRKLKFYFIYELNLY